MKTPPFTRLFSLLGHRLGLTVIALTALALPSLEAAEPPARENAATPASQAAEAKKSKIGIIIYSTDAETVWNAFRFASFALDNGDSVKVFLLAKGVDCEKLNTKDFNITEMMQKVVDAGGKILACGTCLTLRNSEGSKLCPMSTMNDMYEIVKESDKVLTF